MELLVISVNEKKNLKQIILKAPKSIKIMRVPFPISLILLCLFLFKETQLRYLGFGYRNVLTAKIFLKNVVNLLKAKSPNFLESIRGMIIIRVPNKSGLNQTLSNLICNSTGVDKFWLSRSMQVKYGISHDLQFHESEFEQQAEVLVFAHIKLVSRGNSTRNTDKTREMNVSDFPKDLRIETRLKFKTMEMAIVENGTYVRWRQEIVSTSPYFTDELPRDFPSLLPTFLESKKALTLESLSIQNVSEGIFVGVNRNYYHAMWENIPRVLRFRQENGVKLAPILPTGLPSQIVDMFRFASDMEPIFCRPREGVQLKSLVVSLDGRFQSRVDYQKQSRENIFESRRGDLYSLRDFADGLVKKSVHHTRFFISRASSDSRIPSNLAKLQAFMDSNGFVVVNPLDLTLSEQIAIFESAEELVIMTGAAVSNMAFSKNLRHVTFIVGASPQDQAARTFWPQYAEFLGIEYSLFYAIPNQEIDILKLKTFMKLTIL